jgi:outer membrane protein OmpA-like peptidoglycan-associated protein
MTHVFTPAWRSCWVAAVMASVAVLHCPPTQAQAKTEAAVGAPTAQEMIDQLQAPRTRGLSRNLKVEAAPAANAGDAPANTAPQGGGFALAANSDPTLNLKPSLSLLIQFDFNSTKVRPESQQALANLSQALQSTQLRESKFAVEGHTDAKGNADYNQKLSLARAQAVREYLKTQGVADKRLVAAGKGASDLANPGEPLAPENRRVRIVNLD